MVGRVLDFGDQESVVIAGRSRPAVRISLILTGVPGRFVLVRRFNPKPAAISMFMWVAGVVYGCPPASVMTTRSDGDEPSGPASLA